jgi:hypothetical protein
MPRAVLVATLTALLLAGCAESPPTTPESGTTPAPNCAFAPDIEGCKRELQAQERELQAKEREAAGQPPEKVSLGLASAGAHQNGSKTYIVSASTDGLHWEHIVPEIAGAPLRWTPPTTCGRAESGQWHACENKKPAAAESTVTPGAALTVTAETGQTLRLTVQ